MSKDAEQSPAEIAGQVFVVRGKRVMMDSEIVGFETMRLFGSSTPAHVVDGKILVRRGTVFGRNAYATPHLSAAWGLRNIDLDRIASFLIAQPT